jgi:hypothetical protein
VRVLSWVSKTRLDGSWSSVCLRLAGVSLVGAALSDWDAFGGVAASPSHTDTHASQRPPSFTDRAHRLEAISPRPRTEFLTCLRLALTRPDGTVGAPLRV